MTSTSAPASRATSAVAAPIPEAPPTTSARLPSYRNPSNRLMSCPPIVDQSSRDHAAHLEVENGVPVDAELAQYGVAVLVELGRSRRQGRLLVVLDRGRHQPEGNAGGGLALLHVPV